MATTGERCHAPKVRAIARLMRDRGFTREKLAMKARMSVNTLRSVLGGHPAFMTTLKRIADALEVPPGEIIEPEPEPIPAVVKKPAGKGRRKAAVVIAKPFELFDEAKDLPPLIESIKRQYGGTHTIYVIAIAPGSVVVTLDMDEEDAQRLEAAFKAGRLKSLNVTRVYLYPPEEPAADPAVVLPRRPDQSPQEGRGGLPAVPWRLIRYAAAASLLVALGIALKPWTWFGGDKANRDREPLAGMLAGELQARLDRLQIADGPFKGGFRLQQDDGRLNWYFANLGLMPLVKTEPAAVALYLDLYLKNTDPATGTIADVKDIATGLRQPPDSDDSYAATFLSLASRYVQATDDRAWWQENRPRLKEIARKVLLSAQKPSGLVQNFVGDPARAAGYLMDNAEVYRGLADFSGQLARDNDADAPEFADAAARVARGIAGLFDEQAGHFRVADIPAAATFYPLRTAQVFPQIFGVPLGDDAQTKRKYDAAWAFLNAAGDKWERGEVSDGSLGGYPWMVLGYAAALRGEDQRAREQYRRFSEELKKPMPSPQYTAVNELGWATLTRERIVQGNQTSP